MMRTNGVASLARGVGAAGDGWTGVDVAMLACDVSYTVELSMPEMSVAGTTCSGVAWFAKVNKIISRDTHKQRGEYTQGVTGNAAAAGDAGTMMVDGGVGVASSSGAAAGMMMISLRNRVFSAESGRAWLALISMSMYLDVV